MKRLLITNFIIIVLLLPLQYVHAGWLEDNWNSMTSSSVSAPDMIQKQGGGAYYGGGFSFSTGGSTTTRLVPVDIRMPSISAGCGGIDIVTGAFDYNAEELINFLKSLVSNAPGYAFQLAMQIFCPSCLDILNTLNEITGMINGMQMDSCAVLQGLTDLASNATEKAIASNSDFGKAMSYRKSMSDFNDNMKDGFKKFFNKIRDNFGCLTNGKGCKSIDFLEGKKSFLQGVFENIEENQNDSSLKKYFGSNYQQLFRALVGDIRFIQVNSDGNNGDSLKLYPIEPIYSGNEKNALDTLIYGHFNALPSKGENNDYVKKGMLDVMVLMTDTENKTYVKNVAFDTFSSIAFDIINSSKEKYNVLDRSQSLSPQELSFLSTLKTPVLKTLNVLFIDDYMPRIFLEELKPLAGVQFAYEIISIVAKNMQLSMNQYKEEISGAGLYNEEIDLAINRIRQNMAKLQRIAYEQYITQYVAFEERIKTIGKDGIFDSMKNTRAAYFSRHPVIGSAVFAGGIPK